MKKITTILDENQIAILEQVISTSGASNISEALRLLIDNCGLLLCAGIDIHEKSTIIKLIKLNSKEN